MKEKKKGVKILPLFIVLVLIAAGVWFFVFNSPAGETNTLFCNPTEDLINGECVLRETEPITSVCGEDEDLVNGECVAQDDPVVTTNENLEKAQAVKDSVKDSVLKIEASNGVDTYYFSGVAIHRNLDKYYLVTSNYYVSRYDSLIVRFEDGTVISADIEGIDPYSELAIISFTSSKDIDLVTFDLDHQYEPSEIVVSVGNFEDTGPYMPLDQYEILDVYSTESYNPSTYFGEGYQTYSLNVTSNKMLYFGEGYIKHNLVVNDSNNGGGLFNLDGEFIGLNTTIEDINYESVGYAIPSIVVERVMASLINDATVERAALLYDEALAVATILEDPGFYSEYTIPENVTKGVYITGIYGEGIMSIAGLEDGDIILQIDNVTIDDPSIMLYLIHYAHTLVDDITFLVNRGGTEIELSYDHTLYTNDYYTFRHFFDAGGNEIYGEYFGQIKEGMVIFYSIDGSITLANFHNDLLDGDKTVYYPNLNFLQGTYNNGELFFIETLYVYNGSYYDYYYGETLNGVPHGEGTLTLSTYGGGSYVGSFVNGSMEGYGYKYFDNNDTYEGYFTNTMMNGLGTYTFEDTSLYLSYIGQFLNDIPFGEGSLYFSDTSYLTANFTDWNNAVDGTLFDASSNTLGSCDFVNGVLILE